ncbi:hypothetical protein [Kitasatospora sp. NPDC001175]
MGEHVHVRLRHGLDVNEQGELVEHLRCGCGEVWSRTHRVEDGEAER